MGQIMTQNLYVGINKRDEEGQTALHRAVIMDNLSEVEQLISQGAYVNARDNDNGTPLHSAVGNDFYIGYENSYEISEILLKNGADLKARDKYNLTPLEFLARTGNVEKFQLFQKFNADFHELSETQLGAGCNLLFTAAYHNKNVEAVQYLIDLGLDVHCRNKVNGKMPIHVACFNRHLNLNMIKCFLKNGADINAVDFERSTPLREVIHCVNTYLFSDKLIKNLNFMLEHCCLAVPHSEINILECRDRPLLEFVWKIILSHIAKLQTLNITMHPLILDAISKEGKYNKYCNQCKEELLRAKNTKFSNSWVSFYNLLIDNRKRLKNYAGNEMLIEEFENSDCENKFLTYGATMVENMKKGMKRRELFDKSAFLLSDCLPIFSPSHLITRDILDCVLSKKDLLKFCELD